MGYCTVAQVVSSFPQFQQGAAGSITNASIQTWIDQRAARVRSAFVARGWDPDAQALTTSQSDFLAGINADGAIADVGDALQGTVNLQPGEYSVAAAHRKSYETVLKEIGEGLHDVLAQPDLASTVYVGPLFDGISGGTGSISASGMVQEPAFTKDQVF